MRAEKFNRRYIAISLYRWSGRERVGGQCVDRRPRKESVSTADISTAERLVWPFGSKVSLCRSALLETTQWETSSHAAPLSDKKLNREHAENLIKFIQAYSGKTTRSVGEKEILINLEEQLPDEVIIELERLRSLSVMANLKPGSEGRVSYQGSKQVSPA